MGKIALMYHDVYLSSPDESGMNALGASQYKISLDSFEMHVKAVSDYCDNRHIPKSLIEFTFDDGGSSFGTLIPNILDKYGFKGVFFISTDFIDQRGFICSNEIKELSERGHIIGSHTKSHPEHLEKMNSEKVFFEWSSSLGLLSTITGYPIKFASLPNGNGSSMVLRCAAQSGILHLYTSEPTLRIKHQFGMNVIGRFVVHNNMNPEDIIRIINCPFSRFRRLIRFRIIDFIKSLLGDSYIKLKSLFIID